MTLTPRRDSEARVTAFEVEIETVWVRLTRLRGWTRKTVCLSPNTGALVMRWPRELPYENEVGTYTKDVSLIDFRADCFHAKEGNRK
jgi:hypothetical protein